MPASGVPAMALGVGLAGAPAGPGGEAVDRITVGLGVASALELSESKVQRLNPQVGGNISLLLHPAGPYSGADT